MGRATNSVSPETESAIDRLTGILKNKVPANTKWKEVKANYLKEKYGL